MQKDTPQTDKFLSFISEIAGDCISYFDERRRNHVLEERIIEEWGKTPYEQFHFDEMYQEIEEHFEKLKGDDDAIRKYAYSLLLPFRQFSAAFYGVEKTRIYQESIDELKGEAGAEKLIDIYNGYIKRTKERNRKFYDITQNAIKSEDDLELIFSGIVLNIQWYSNMIDAAFVVNHLNLAEIQKECGVYIKYWNLNNIKYRASEIQEHIGSYTLAERYLSQLYSKENKDSEDVQKPSKDNPETEEPTWVLMDKENYQTFSLENVNYKKLYDLLVDKEIGIMSKSIPLDYFIDVARRGLFGVIYNHSNTLVTKFRYMVTQLSKHIENIQKRKEYREITTRSMGLKDKEGNFDVYKLGKFKINKNDKFIIELGKIL